MLTITEVKEHLELCAKSLAEVAPEETPRQIVATVPLDEIIERVIVWHAHGQSVRSIVRLVENDGEMVFLSSTPGWRVEENRVVPPPNEPFVNVTVLIPTNCEVSLHWI